MESGASNVDQGMKNITKLDMLKKKEQQKKRRGKQNKQKSNTLEE